MSVDFNQDIIEQIALENKLKANQVTKVLALLQAGNTIPFIARYRKDETDGLDENQIFEINKVFEYQTNLLARKEDVIRLIDEKGLLTEQLKSAILQAKKLIEVENIYQPYKNKKETKASIAKQLGFETIALKVMHEPDFKLEKHIHQYVTDEIDEMQAIKYVQDIIAQITCEHTKVRAFVLENIQKGLEVITKVKKDHDDEKQVFLMYYDYREPLIKIANHRLLGINRAVNKKVVSLSLVLENDNNVENIYAYFFKRKPTVNKEIVIEAIKDGYKRLLYPSLTRQLFSVALENASRAAIEVFSLNLEKLLITPPLKNKVILGFDPAYTSGCKIAIINSEGELLNISLIYPFASSKKNQIEAETKMLELLKEYKVDIIAIGNGTASRESEEFIANLIQIYDLKVAAYAIVSEAGASVYSASKIAQYEFPDLSVEQRSAISIARRLLNPLGEYIKIDAKSIGVGQYQHDVNQKELNNKLDFTLSKVVNDIGVDLNTTSSYLLSNISGISSKLSENIIQYRKDNNGFKSRKDLLSVKGLGPKAFEQAAGFLKVYTSLENLDHTIIHPQDYSLAYQIIEYLGLDKADIGNEKYQTKIKQVSSKVLANELSSNEYTVTYILKALNNPYYDIRDTIDTPLLRSDVLKIEDLVVGSQLEGIVRNVVDFGVFVDIGLKNDALLHISKISQEFIKHPSQKLAINDIIKVTIEKVDLVRKNVSLTLI